MEEISIHRLDFYAQPRRTCECGSRVFELHTCRSCGSAFFKAYAFDAHNPDYLWAEDVGEVDFAAAVVQPLFLALEEPPPGSAAPISNTSNPCRETRLGRRQISRVWLPGLGQNNTPAGMFASCPRCGAPGDSIMDHVTKGDEPFQEVAHSSQLLEQPPRADVRTPLKGRKTLIFS